MRLTSAQRRQRNNRFKVRRLANISHMLCVFRSNKHFYGQIIDKDANKVIVSASTVEKGFGMSKTYNIEAAKLVGEILAKRAIEANIKHAVFDRGKFLYHGRVKVFCEAVREGGIQI